MSTPTAVEKGKHRVEQYEAFFDVLAERADAYAKRGAHKLAWKLLAGIDDARRMNARTLASDQPDTVEAGALACSGNAMILVEELGKVHLSLVSRSVSNAVKEIRTMICNDTDLGALAAVIRHYFSA